MKRKMLISIALITIMLLNCIMPSFVVNAVEGEEIQLNSSLYKAVKSSLSKQGILYSKNDVTHTITLSSDAKASITELNLNDSSISDLTGLDAFSNLTHLELSGNNLTKDSNLGVLNSLPLTYLDLSTNRLEDVSEIRELISRLQSQGTIILSNQSVSIVESVYVDSEEGSDDAETATFELPPILELAGYIKSCWKSTNSVPETYYSTAPFLDADGIPMYVNSETHTIEVNICSESGKGYYGLLEVIIHIYDDATEAASEKNPNKAAENILNGSEFKLYYVVHDKSSEAITTMDTNLYNAIKEQLTAGQTINSDLPSYPYAIDPNGNIVYEEFTYKVDGDYRILKNIETGKEQYAYNPETKTLYEYDGSDIGDVVNTIIEEITISEEDDEGNISSKAGYKIAFVGEDSNRTLYIQAYDDAKTFVIYDAVLTNDITSLILNNKQIRDLSGIEYFIGLKSKLNVSHNYLNDIEPIYNMETQKANWEAQMVAEYTKWLKGREEGSLATAAGDTNGAFETIGTNKKSITDAYSRILNILAEAADVDTTKENYQSDLESKASSINAILDDIYGKTDDEGNYKPGYWDLIQGYTANGEEFDGAIDEINNSINEIYYYLQILYLEYVDEYKLTTLLSPELNYMNYEEYQAYDQAIHESAESAKGLLNSEISFLKTLETQNGLSDLDKLLFTKEFGVVFDTTKTKTPLADYFDELLQKNNFSRTQTVDIINRIREIALYSEMANYCLIKRMNVDTASGYCYEEEYLERKISDFDIEDIDTPLEEAVLNAIKENKSYSSLYDTYKSYVNRYATYTNEDSDEIIVNACKGEYIPLDEMIVEYTAYTQDELITNALNAAKSDTASQANIEYVLGKLGQRADQIINTVDLYEVINDDYLGEKDVRFLYNQMITLANKLLNGDVERYVTLARLKDLDISYNAELENIERISELTNLYNLDASYCYIADVSNVDWASMTKLKNLSLAYNYISDITPLTNLPNLKSLNLSNNLISGKLDIPEEQYQKLFKNMLEFNLSGNQITDIESLLVYLDYISGGDYANYLAREDTINIDLSKQNIELRVYDPIYLSDYPTTIDVELPKIFTQLLAIDTERTAFGETSQNGRIESEGTYVTLNTRTTGDKMGKVVVLAMSGNGEEVETCIGEGTTATIYYTVKDRTVNSVRIYPSDNLEAENGDTIQFMATVEGEDLNDKTVTWEIEDNSSENTTISPEGLLTIGEDEESDSILVIARSNFKPSVLDMVEVKLPSNPGISDDDNTVDPGNTVDPDENVIDPDENVVDPDENVVDPDENVVDPDENVVDPDENVVDPDENVVDPDENVVDPDENVVDPGDNTVDPDDPTGSVVDPDDLGYDKENTYLTNVAAKTPIEDFESIFLNGLEYTVEVTKDNREITSGYMTTGMEVKLVDTNGNTAVDENGDEIAYHVVVKGDINGDGYANSLDTVLIKAHRNEVQVLEGYEFEAADINNDGVVNVTDAKLLLYHRAEVTGYDLNFKK